MQVGKVKRPSIKLRLRLQALLGSASCLFPPLALHPSVVIVLDSLTASEPVRPPGGKGAIFSQGGRAATKSRFLAPLGMTCHPERRFHEPQGSPLCMKIAWDH